jgi:hypothetical protein
MRGLHSIIESLAEELDILIEDKDKKRLVLDREKDQMQSVEVI